MDDVLNKIAEVKGDAIESTFNDTLVAFSSCSLVDLPRFCPGGDFNGMMAAAEESTDQTPRRRRWSLYALLVLCQVWGCVFLGVWYRDVVGVETGALRGKLSDTPPRQEMYLPWELQAMGTTCHPPEGTPTRCCTGSSSAGGNVHWTPNHGCKAAPYARLPDHSSESVSTLLKHLSATNQTMGFTGDSLMYQLVVGFECEWLRQGWTTTHHTQVPRTKRDDWQYGVGTMEEWVVRKKNSTAHIFFWLQYRPYEDMSEMAEIVHASDILMLNFGAHWLPSTRKEYTTDMTRLWKFLKPFANTTFFIWREKFAQHRDSDGGEWDQDSRSDHCVPVVYEAVQHQWREKRIRKLLQEVQLPIYFLNETPRARRAAEVFWLPIQDLSETWLDMHPLLSLPLGQNGTKCEVTHYCQTPYLWGEVWRLLAVFTESLYN